MGSSQSSYEQTQRYFSSKITDILSQKIEEHRKTIVQEARTVQRIEGLDVRLPEKGYCGYQPQGGVVISQEAINAAVSAASLKLLTNSDIANDIKRSVEATSKADVTRDKDGFLNWTDNVNGKQTIEITDNTYNQIKSLVHNKVETYTKQSQSTDQVIKGLVVYVPCGGLEINQHTVSQMWAKDIGEAVTDLVLKSADANDYVSKIASQDKQKTTDIFNSLFNNAAAMVRSVSLALGQIGSSWAVGAALVVLAVVFLAPAILGAVLGGGGGGGGDDDD